MERGKIADAERFALNELDKWNNVTGQFEPGSGYYHEVQGLLEDAVHIGIQMALHGKVNYDADGNVVKQT